MSRHFPDLFDIIPASRMRRFGRDEDGSLIIFSLFIFVLMLIIGGIGLDIERFETARTKLQNTADSAALAAASLSQTVTSQEIVDSYFDVQDMAPFFENLTVFQDANTKRVRVDADINVPTHFFNMIGVNNLGTIVSSIAEESIGNVEISLVLDVSGSMGSNSKLANLKVAAGQFVDAIYASAAPGTVSTSVVPYSTQVSAGPEVLKHFPSLADPHSRSHCLDFADGDFASTSLVPGNPAVQSAHFDARTNEWSSWRPGNSLRYIECPTVAWRDILLFSEDTSDLKDYVNAFQASNWTSIELGVKWGAALLDPAFQPIVSGHVADGLVGSDFDGRPRAFNDSDTLKVLVVMSDGTNTNQYKLTNFRSGPSPVFAFVDAAGRTYYSIWRGTGTPVLNATQALWYRANTYANDGLSVGWFTNPLGAVGAVQLDWQDVWAQVPLEYFADGWLANMGWTNLQNQIKAARGYHNQTAKDSRTRDICAAAKAQGILVYTIGFEAPYASQVLLEDCANTVSHFFNVAGTDISMAFAAIASDINRLRLVQ